MEYKIAIFDLDGTLLDTLQDLANSTNFALSSFGYPERSLEEVRRFVGNGIEKLIERAVPKNTASEERARVLSAFKTHYAEDFAVKALCEKYFGNRISVAVGEREGIRRKPYPDSVFEVLDKTGFVPAEAVYIGDSEVDVQTAEHAGTDMITVTWGFRDEDFLIESGARVFADSADELEHLILSESARKSEKTLDKFQ